MTRQAIDMMVATARTNYVKQILTEAAEVLTFLLCTGSWMLQNTTAKEREEIGVKLQND